MFQFSVPQRILYQCVEEEKIWKSDNGCNSLYIMICAAHCQNFSVTCTSSILVTSITWHCWYHMIRCTLSSLVTCITWYCMVLHSWLPNQMISLVLIFGFLCRSSIPRWLEKYSTAMCYLTSSLFYDQICVAVAKPAQSWLFNLARHD